MLNYRQLTYLLTSQIPKGKVLTYKSLAILASIPSPRLVGLYLHQNPYPFLPCYRVVNSAGKIVKTYAFGGGDIQKQRLESDGIIFSHDKINLSSYLWKPDIFQLNKIQLLFNQKFLSTLNELSFQNSTTSTNS